MWAFRRDPASVTPEEQRALEGLFEKIPKVKDLYRVRLRFKDIFDTARDRTTAARWLRRLRRETEDLGLDLGGFFATSDQWKPEIRNSFDARQTSAAVEGINNKARVITKRTYGLKSAQSLWNRLILDLNRASEAIGWTIEQIRQLAKGLTAGLTHHFPQGFQGFEPVPSTSTRCPTPPGGADGGCSCLCCFPRL